MVAASLPVEIVLGVYLGILTGIVPALVAWGLGFAFKYVTGVTIPGFGVVVLALAIAGINGGLLALSDPTVTRNASAEAIVVAIVVVTMLTFYAHAKGDTMGATFPKRVSLASLREQTLSTDVVELVGGRGQVRVEVTRVADMEGYPPLPDDIRTEIIAEEWTFPADLPIGELESRFADRLRTEFDCADVSVRIDERGRATVTAAPPLSGLSKHVPDGQRAVSVEALLPTGLARGDRVTVLTVPPEPTADDGAGAGGTGNGMGGDAGGTTAEDSAAGAADAVGETGAAGGSGDGDAAGPVEPVRTEGVVVSARTTGTASSPAAGSPATDGGTDAPEAVAPPPRAPTTDGGEGRITVAVERPAAAALLRADRGRVVVASRGTRREFELVSLLRRAGRRFRRLTVREGGALDGVSLGAAAVRESHGVAVLAVRRAEGWSFAPRGGTTLEPGDELFAVGSREALDSFAEVVA